MLRCDSWVAEGRDQSQQQQLCQAVTAAAGCGAALHVCSVHVFVTAGLGSGCAPSAALIGLTNLSPVAGAAPDKCAGLANNAAVAFEVQLQQSFAPLVAMAAMIHVQPYYPTLEKRFDEIAAELIAQVRAASNFVSTDAATVALLLLFGGWAW